MKDRNFLNRLITIALPISFQALMLASVAAADAFMLGSVEQNMMAAVSLATQIQFVQNIIISCIIAATVVLGAQYWGKQDMQSINDVYCISLRFCIILSFLFFIGCSFFPKFLMSLYTNDATLISIGVDYLRIAGFSYLLTGFSQCYLAMMKVTDHVNTVAVISTIAVILNILINAILIYGFAMGAKGAACATLTSRIIEALLVTIFSFKKGYVHPTFKGLTSFNKLLTLDFIKCAWPLLGAGLLWGIGFTSYTSFMGHMGADAAAANSVTAVVRDLVCCACDGLASGCGILVGNALGAGDLDTGKKYGKNMVPISFLVGIASTVLMFILLPIILHAVKLTPNARTYLIQMMIVMAVYMIGRSVNTILINGVFTAGGDTLFDMYSLVVAMWFIAVPLAALGTYIFHWPVVLVYACTCLDEVGKIPWTLYHFRKYKWVKDLTR